MSFPQAVGRNLPYIDVQAPPFVAQRAPDTDDVDYPKGYQWIDESASPSVLYTHMGSGVWDRGGNPLATTTAAGIVTINTDGTLAGADDTTVPTSLAVKTYADALAIAAAPVATEAVQGIGELATDTEAVNGTASTALKALFVTPSNLAAVFAAPSAIGGTTAAAGTFTALTTDGTGAVTLDANAASQFTTTAGDITIDSNAGSVIIDGGEAVADAVLIDASNAAGGIDIDAGTGGITVDSDDAISIDAAAASNFSCSAGDLTIDSAAGSLILSSGENVADSIVITADAGGIDILAPAGAAGQDIDIVNTGGSVNISATEGVADAINIDASAGGMDVDVAGQMNLASSQNATDAIRLNASAGGIDIDAAGAAGEDITIDNAAGSIALTSGEAIADSLVLSAGGGMDILAPSGGAGLDIDITNTGGSVNISASEAIADAVVINGSSGGVDILAGGGAGLDIDITNTSGSVIVSGGEAVANAVSLQAAAGGVDIDGALQVNIASSQAAADAVRIDASNAAGGIDVDDGGGGMTFDSLAGISLDAAAASNFSVSGAGIDLTLASAGGRVVVNGEEAAADALRLLSAAGGLDADVALQMNLASSQNAADAIRINASAGGIDIDAAGAAGEDIAIDNAAGSIILTAGEAVANAISLQSTGGVDVDGALQVNIASSQNAADAIRLSASAGGIDVDAVGSAGEDIVITNTGGSVELEATESAGDAMRIKASGAAGGIDLEAGTGGVSMNSGLIMNVTSKANGDSPYALLGSDFLVSCDVSAGVLEIDLPGAPATGRVVWIYDASGNANAANITIDGNGNNIALGGSVAGTKTIATDYGSAYLVYNGTIWLGRAVS